MARCVQNIFLSSYFPVAWQKYVPIAPGQLKGRIEIPEYIFEEILNEKAFKKSLLIAFLVDFERFHEWLKTDEGRLGGEIR